ncbi:hypothetical protein PN36_10905 [Candidatus Thiomargarita nelsonii]|uniref:Uncharacterized protein n=1 Tax=Candidatus Thiomargarita nelsonii TaxID=1003181 RepID=A0A4E0QQ79_9GAMM|nr:hypothetical protein PN36_10905 [Candidatus Thiomargarita nelsonii]
MGEPTPKINLGLLIPRLRAFILNEGGIDALRGNEKNHSPVVLTIHFLCLAVQSLAVPFLIHVYILSVQLREN